MAAKLINGESTKASSSICFFTVLNFFGDAVNLGKCLGIMGVEDLIFLLIGWVVKFRGYVHFCEKSEHGGVSSYNNLNAIGYNKKSPHT